MIIRSFVLICDECFRDELVYADNLAEAKQEAKARGWITTKGRECYCTQQCHLHQAIRKMTAKEDHGADIYIPET